MKYLTLLFFLLINAVNAQGHLDYRTDTVIRSRVYHDMFVLASDSLQGRRSGTFGEKKAAAYIVESFRKAGLKPKGDGDTSYLQSFPEPAISPWNIENKLVAGNHVFVFYKDFGATKFSGNGYAKGKVVNTGFGISYPEMNWDDYSDLADLSGKIAVINLGLPSWFKGRLLTGGMLTPSARIRNALARGAAGIILWNNDSPFFNDLFDFDSADTVTIPVIFANSPFLLYLDKHKETIVEMRIKVTRKLSFYHNVIGFIDNHAAGTVIFGAHYDHMGINSRSEIRYGADDNASGTVTIMELARWLSQSGDKKNNYLFIAFSGEEEWLKGSTWFCNHPTVDLSTVRFMFNFDMVGRLGCEGRMIYAFATGTSPIWKKIYRAMPSFGFRVNKFRGAANFSDHYPFYQKQIPEVYLTTGFHYDYHTKYDTPDKINFDGMLSVVRYTEEFLRRAGEFDSIPFSKPSGWYQFSSTLKYIYEELDYVLTVGTGGSE
ncbi:MAG: M28 family peptidase [Bacteroidetes bacterium]|nr:M28 family peptidase [Bacteroidota bacterium]